MEIISKKEVSELYNVHIRTICYYLKIKKGLVGYRVKCGKVNINGEIFDIPDRLDKRTNMVFIKSEVIDYFNYNIKDHSSENIRY